MEGLRLQLNGYCLITILKKGGLLLHGDPKAGIAQIGENSFLFANTDCLNEYAGCLVSNVKYVGETLYTPEFFIFQMPLSFQSFLQINTLSLQTINCMHIEKRTKREKHSIP